MCHQPESKAPAPPLRHPVASHARTTLRAEDGTWLRAYRALSTAPNGMSVIILPDVRGLHPFYEDLTVRFAEAGFSAMAIDFYGRTTGTNPHDASFNWREHLPHVRHEHVEMDARAAATLLRQDNPGPLFTVGFCFGGGHSWRLAASRLGLAGAIGFYGLPYLVEDVIENISAPLLMLLAGHDKETPHEHYDRIAALLDYAGKQYETHTYESAPHSFFDRSSHQWQAVCTDAWRRLLAFTQRHSLVLTNRSIPETPHDQ